MGRAGHTPARRVLAVAAVVAGSALALDACGGGQNGQALAQQACVHVDRSVRDYLLSTRPGTAPATAAQLQAKADSELRLALPLAAAANSADGSWNALMTTISEGATVDEQHLVPSLRAQCVVANTNPNVNPQSPGSTTPQNVNPEPASAGG